MQVRPIAQGKVQVALPTVCSPPGDSVEVLVINPVWRQTDCL